MNLKELMDQKYAVVLGVFLGLLVFIPFLKSFFREKLKKFIQKRRANFNTQLIDALNVPIFALFLTSAVSVIIPLAPHIFERETLVTYGVRGLFIFSIFWVLENIFSLLIFSKVVFPKLNSSHEALFSTMVKLILLSMGFLMALSSFGISITPILASLGVGSLAVALALQDTLNNFFSGLYLLIDQPIRIGDFVQINAETKGKIKKIGWRSTHVLLGTHDVAVIPNSKLASAELINFNFPNEETIVTLPFTVAPGTNLPALEKTVLEVANKTQATPAAVKDFLALLRFTALGEQGLSFTVVMKAKTYDDRALIIHDFIKAIHLQFEKEKISFRQAPFLVQLKEQL